LRAAVAKKTQKKSRYDDLSFWVVVIQWIVVSQQQLVKKQKQATHAQKWGDHSGNSSGNSSGNGDWEHRQIAAAASSHSC